MALASPAPGCAGLSAIAMCIRVAGQRVRRTDTVTATCPDSTISVAVTETIMDSRRLSPETCSRDNFIQDRAHQMPGHKQGKNWREHKELQADRGLG